MIITTHLIMMFLPSIVNIINYYFEFINPPWLLNRKQQPRQDLLKRYRKQLYRQKIKIRKFFPTSNQLLENTDEATRPITNKLPDNWDELFKNHRELPPKEFQFSIRKQWKTPTDCSEGDRKFNNNSPTDCSEGVFHCFLMLNWNSFGGSSQWFLKSLSQLFGSLFVIVRVASSVFSISWLFVGKNFLIFILCRYHCELPSKEFQFSIGKQWKTPTDFSEGDRKVNNNSPTDCSEGYRKVNNNSISDLSEVYVRTVYGA